MKKVFAILFVFAVVALSGCGGNYTELEPYNPTPENTGDEQPLYVDDECVISGENSPEKHIADEEKYPQYMEGENEYNPLKTPYADADVPNVIQRIAFDENMITVGQFPMTLHTSIGGENSVLSQFTNIAPITDDFRFELYASFTPPYMDSSNMWTLLARCGDYVYPLMPQHVVFGGGRIRFYIGICYTIPTTTVLAITETTNGLFIDEFRYCQLHQGFIVSRIYNMPGSIALGIHDSGFLH